MIRIYNRPRLLVLLLALAVGALGHRAPLVPLDNSPESFFAADREARATYREAVEVFGADEVILVELRGASYRRAADLEGLARLARELEGLDDVEGVLSIASVYDWGTGEVEVDERAVADVAAELEAFPLYGELGLVRPEALGVLVTTTVRGAEGRVALTEAIGEVVERFDTERLEPAVAGLTPTHAAFDRLTRRALTLFMPAVVLINVLVGLILFRSGRALVALFVPALAAVAVGLSGLEVAGQTLNLVTAVLPPLVLSIGFAASIHLVTHYGNSLRDGLEPFDAARQTIREKLAPTAFAFGTTALAFGTLAMSSVPTVRVLGLSAAGTLLAALLLVGLGTPALLLWLRPSIHVPLHRRRTLVGLARWSLRHRPAVLAVGALIALGLLAGVPRLEPSINGVQLLPEGTPERVSYERLEAAGVGLGAFDLWIQTPIRGREALEGERARLETLAGQLEAVEGVTATLSVADLLAVGEHRLERLEARTGDRTAALRQLAGGGELRQRLSRWWSPSQGLRVSVMTQTADDPEAVEEQRAQLHEATRALYPEAPVELTGHYAMLIAAPGALTETLATSLGVTALVVALLFFALLRSPRLALSGMTANLLPVLAVIGVMGWLGVPVDVATVMTGSVVFGLAVDDTFHYLYHRRESGSLACAASIAGQGIVATTFVVAAGFSALGLTGFAPVLRFGLLAAFGAVAALGFDAFLLPALVGERRDEAERCQPARDSSSAVSASSA